MKRYETKWHPICKQHFDKQSLTSNMWNVLNKFHPVCEQIRKQHLTIKFVKQRFETTVQHPICENVSKNKWAGIQYVLKWKRKFYIQYVESFKSISNNSNNSNKSSTMFRECLEHVSKLFRIIANTFHQQCQTTSS